ncbi:MAG: hypothetical protein E6G60_15210, partial [Actinobacteria bacterium]
MAAEMIKFAASYAYGPKSVSFALKAEFLYSVRNGLAVFSLSAGPPTVLASVPLLGVPASVMNVA